MRVRRGAFELDAKLQHYPLVGSIQNSAGMGFIGNQAVSAVANGLGVRVVCVPAGYVSAHADFPKRVTWSTDPENLRKAVAFLISRKPAVIVLGSVPRANLVDVIAAQLNDYKGIVLLDPALGDFDLGLYAGAETARMVREALLPHAQVVTLNRFEAEALSGSAGAPQLTEHAFLNRLFDLGPKAVIVTSFERDLEKRRMVSLFTNGYTYARITSPYYPMFSAHGAGDIFAAGVAVFMTLGASPFAASLLSTALAARAVANTSDYTGTSPDPIAALERWEPLGYQVEDDRAASFAAKSMVEVTRLKAVADEAARLKLEPPPDKIDYG